MAVERSSACGSCPKCGSQDITFYGSSRGTPEIKCKSCGKRTLTTLIHDEGALIDGLVSTKAIGKGKPKRVLIGADTQCGSLVGLTPPRWQLGEHHDSITKLDKYARIEREGWDWYTANIDVLKPFDLAIFNGDCIDGRGEHSGGTELITTDRITQCEMAVECIRRVGAKKVVLTYGTAYHAGMLEDFENIIAKDLGAKIGSHEWVDVNGLVFDIKHKVGRTSIPHGGATPALRESLWSILWAEAEMTPKSHIVVRSHTHSSVDVKVLGLPRVIVTPSLQGMGTKFGSRECSGLVSFGFVVFDVYEDGSYVHRFVEAEIKSQKASVIKI